MSEQIEGQVRAVLRGVETASIRSRLKQPESAFLKLQRGEVRSLTQVEDLVGVKVVVLHPGELSRAFEAVKSGMNVVRVVNDEVSKPEEFRYKEPHVIVRLPESVVLRHPETTGITAEIQITTYLQHALQESVHSVAYKGDLLSWSRWRLAAQLRGMLELADNVLEQVAKVAELQEDPVYATFDARNAIIKTSRMIFREPELPEDLRRLALIIEGFLRASQMSLEELVAAFNSHPDLRDAISLSPVDKVIAVILREKGRAFIDRLPKSHRIVVSPELKDACPLVEQIPADRKVEL